MLKNTLIIGFNAQNFLEKLYIYKPTFFTDLSSDNLIKLEELINSQISKLNYPNLIPTINLVFIRANKKLFNNTIIRKLIINAKFYRINLTFLILELNFTIPKVNVVKIDNIFILNDLLLDETQKLISRNLIFNIFEGFFTSFNDLNIIFNRIFEEKKYIFLNNSSINYQIECY